MAEIHRVTVEEFMNEYEQIRTPDFASIASYVIRAKGAERNMAQFAEATGISASTLSRIVNRKTQKPLSKESIVKIYEARAFQEETALLDSLARANGMFPKEYVERVKTTDDFAAHRNKEISREHMMKNALIAGVASSGIQFKSVINAPRYRASEIPAYIPRRRGNFIITLGEPAEGFAQMWTFFLYPYILGESEEAYYRSPSKRVYDIFREISGWLLMDAWNHDCVQKDKFSFCFVDEELFQEFVDTMQIAKLHTEMTAILMDTENYTVLREVWLPGDYDRISEESIFRAIGYDTPDDFDDEEETE